MKTRKLLSLDLADDKNRSLDELQSWGWDIHTAENLHEAKALIETYRFQVGVVSFNAVEEANTSSVKELFAICHPMEWIALLSPEALMKQDVCQAIIHYFYDYHTLPIEADRLQIVLGHAYGMANLMQKMKHRVCNNESHEMIGSSPPIMQLFRDIRKVADVDESVLIIGESGTGKELTARAIHKHSARANNPFIPLNCGAIPQSLIHSELFGYEKGAFTGANQSKMGLIEAAAGGTLFLDEIGDLPLELQVNLLRFLQEKIVQRLGGVKEVSVDVRIIAATHVDLEKAVADRRFREDLYYRLSVVNIKVPPLRERREDIELLANYYFELFSNKIGRHIKGFASEAINVMRHYNWPGNVRELINRIKHATVMSENCFITSADLGLENHKIVSWNTETHIITLDETKAKAEKEAIQLALQITENNVSLAAKQLGISRTTFYRLIDKYEVIVDRSPSALDPLISC